MPALNENAPDPDEFELTLLGRGRGESCVVHIGEGRWIIVDSCAEPIVSSSTTGGKVRTRTKKVPSAARYLDRLGVSADAVETIVITHFHLDHYLGVGDLHDKYSKARLVVTRAVGSDRYRGIFSVKGPASLREVGEAMKRAHDRRSGATGAVSGITQAGQGQRLDDRSAAGIEVWALSPSEDAAYAAVEHMASLLDEDPDAAAIATRLQDDNRTSISLHVQACGTSALLCGDVVNEPGEFGWAAIIENPGHSALPQANIVKVAHHGSRGAHLPEMWSQMVEQRAPMVVAPYWTSRIPTQEDQSRLINLGDLWQTGPSSTTLTTEWTPVARQAARTGIIQARRKPGGEWRIAVEEPAHGVTPASDKES